MLSLLVDCVTAGDGDGLLAVKLLASNQFENDATNFVRKGACGLLPLGVGARWA